MVIHLHWKTTITWGSAIAFFFFNLKPVKCHILHADHFSSDASDLLQINIIQKDKNLTQLTGYSLQL